MRRVIHADDRVEIISGPFKGQSTVVVYAPKEQAPSDKVVLEWQSNSGQREFKVSQLKVVASFYLDGILTKTLHWERAQ